MSSLFLHLVFPCCFFFLSSFHERFILASYVLFAACALRCIYEILKYKHHYFCCNHKTDAQCLDACTISFERVIICSTVITGISCLIHLFFVGFNACLSFTTSMRIWLLIITCGWFKAISGLLETLKWGVCIHKSVIFAWFHWTGIWWICEFCCCDAWGYWILHLFYDMCIREIILLCYGIRGPTFFSCLAFRFFEGKRTQVS